jgi:hypothetical protein
MADYHRVIWELPYTVVSDNPFSLTRCNKMHDKIEKINRLFIKDLFTYFKK